MFVALLGSSRSEMDEYLKADALKVIEALKKEPYTLILGGNSGGVMKEAYEKFLEEKKEVWIIQSKNRQKEDDNTRKDRLLILEDNFARSKAIYEKCDSILFLPGGTGTLAEIFGFLDYEGETGKQKNILLFNETGFYTPLLDFIKESVQKGLIKEEVEDFWKEIKNLQELEEELQKIYRKKEEKRWKK